MLLNKVPADLTRFIDHTLLAADATAKDIEKLCAEAREHKFFSVCVNGCWVATAYHLLEDSDVKVVSVAGFPLGAMTPDAKRLEAEAAVDDGAGEIEVVLNHARLKMGEDKFVLREIIDVVEAADERTVKVILETGLLTNAEKIRAAQLIVESGAQFVQVGTGFGKNLTTLAALADIKLLRETVGPEFGVKVAGGLNDLHTAQAFIEAGATRLGTASGIAIVQS
jgi:deoxyribose-phosphate aldolase